MATFKTTSGEHVLTITVNGLAAVKEAMGIHLAELEHGVPPLAVRLRTDPVLLGTVVYHCRKATAAKTGNPPATLAEFLEELLPEYLPGVLDALTEGLVDFFQKSGRADLVAILTETKAVMALAMLDTVARVEKGAEVQKIRQTKALENLDKQLTALRATSSGDAGNTPGSSA